MSLLFEDDWDRSEKPPKRSIWGKPRALAKLEQSMGGVLKAEYARLRGQTVALYLS